MVFTKVTKKQELVGPVGSGKVLLAEKAAEGQKLVFEFILVCQRRVFLHYSKTHSIRLKAFEYA